MQTAEWPPRWVKVAGLGVWTIAMLAVVALAKPPWEMKTWIILGVAAGVIAAIWRGVVLWPMARVEGNIPAVLGVISGTVALPAMAFFMLSAPFVLGASALVLGIEGRRRARNGAGRSGLDLAAIILGAFACLAWIVASLDGSPDHQLWGPR